VLVPAASKLGSLIVTNKLKELHLAAR